ncbi:MAG: rhomboid family intramembrane serine protease [Bacteroidota bacterium]
MRIQYNSPVILTYTLLCAGILFAAGFIPSLMRLFTVVPHAWGWTDPLAYFRLFSHALGHGNLGHLVGNFTLILLIGPILEEKYGSSDILTMMVFTAGVTGILQTIFFSEGLLGASGIAFMLIVLSSVTNFQKGRIPLTFILVMLLFVGQEVYQSVAVSDQVSQFAHIIGGLCGGLFGFMLQGGKVK